MPACSSGRCKASGCGKQDALGGESADAGEPLRQRTPHAAANCRSEGPPDQDGLRVTSLSHVGCTMGEGEGKDGGLARHRATAQ